MKIEVTPEMESPLVQEESEQRAQVDSASVKEQADPETIQNETSDTTTSTITDRLAPSSAIIADPSNSGMVSYISSDAMETNDDGCAEIDNGDTNSDNVQEMKITTEIQDESRTNDQETGAFLDMHEEMLAGSFKSHCNSELEDSDMLDMPRNRPTSGEFLPIEPEMKRIGAEISDEEAQQLKNDVRRLSPILVSQRERTLGEISLTSNSFFDEDNADRDSSIMSLSRLGENDTSFSTTKTEGETGQILALPFGAEGALPTELVCLSEGDAIDAGKLNDSSSASVLRELVIVLSRVDKSESPMKGKPEDCRLEDGASNVDLSDAETAKSQTGDQEVLQAQEKELDNINYEDKSFAPVVQACSTPTTTRHYNDRLIEVTDEKYSLPGSVDARVMPKNGRVMFEKLDSNEEFKLGSFDEANSMRKSIVTKLDLGDEIIFSSPSDRESALMETEVVFRDIVEETETETGSESSDVVRNMGTVCGIGDEDAVMTEALCNDRLIEGAGVSPILTRLQPEQPEAFTEDSAESLALAAGTRDEVRSDGSDSGLGSEIPGEACPAPAPESDSETSFLDRIPDDILSDKEKAVNQLEEFGLSAASGRQDAPQVTRLPVFPATSKPSKGNLKRRLSDCLEGEPSAKRINTDESIKKKKNIQFDAVTVYYFPRSQGFTCVPSQGGSTLGMSATHTHAERFSLSEHATEQRRLHRMRLAQLRSERAANCIAEGASSSEDPSDDTDEEPSDNEDMDIDSYYFLQPVPTWQRRALLRAAGVRRIDALEKDDCRDIRASREHCGCHCKIYCDPESCPCSRANVKCQVDRAGFPCGCSRDGCANTSGRIEFNPVRVRTHFIHTLMRLELEKKQREEGTENDLVESHTSRSPLRETFSSSVDTSADSCLSGSSFTTLHYGCPEGGPDVTGTREDSLDLYTIRDDCYPSEDAVDATQMSQRKLHPEFGQAFQSFQSAQPVAGTVGFPTGAYPDYQAYQALPSTSRSPFQPQFQPVNQGTGFSHYGTYPQDPATLQGCPSQPVQHNAVGYEAPFAQSESGVVSQYTNLNAVQPMNTVVQQMGKLEPFSELLSSRYSYYGDVEPQHVNYLGSAKSELEKNGQEAAATAMTAVPLQQAVNAEESECDENFGEIIKKSMVETVSA